MKKMKHFGAVEVLLLVLTLAAPFLATAQGDQAAPTQQGSGTASRPEELDQMLAPIALYPDSLLAQIMMASTYPVEVVQADRFAKANTKLKGDKLVEAAKNQDWDPSVKAMLQFPDVLAMMSEKLDWTTQLGDAFLSQQKDVMDSIQRLRKKAYDAGNLKTTKEQVVKVEKEIIVVQPASPEVIYVPTYSPTVVYGVWMYPAYPPYVYYPPGYAAATGFMIGVAVGSSGCCWGGWGWHHGEVNIDIDHYNNFTRNNYVHAEKYQRTTNVQNQKWQHNSDHRKGAQYRDQRTAQKFGQQPLGAGRGTTTSDFRGYDRGAGQRAGGPQTSDLSRGEGRESAFKGAGKGASERAASTRGRASRGSRSDGGRRQ